jgi:Mce-associated membrane protein
MADDDHAADAAELRRSTTIDESLAPAESDTADADAEALLDEDEAVDPAERRPAQRHTLRLALTATTVAVVALGALVGWLGLRAHQSQQTDQQRAMYLAAARQGALNLTTISYTEVDADIKRILDSATGTFYDDFQKRSQPFVEVVKQAQSKSQGTVTESALESMQVDSAQALVAVAVTTSTAQAAQQQPRAWRMRISVQKMGDTAKVSNVEFVP